MRWAMILLVGSFVIELACTPWMRVQYMVPTIGFFYVLVVTGLRRLWLLGWEKMPIGKAIVAATLLTFILQSFKCDRTEAALIPLHLGGERIILFDALAKHPNVKYLIIVKYSPAHLR